MNSRKREKPYPSRHAPYSLPKRRRPLPVEDVVVDDSAAASKAPTTVLVIGVPTECSVLDLKSRFEMYGSISRTRMEPNGVAYINFRSKDAAQSAIDAARDSDFPITLHSVPVKVMWASDPASLWRGGVGQKDGLSSKLVRAEVPLRRHGRGNKLGSAIVNLRDEDNGSEGKNGDGEDKNRNNNSNADAISNSGLAGSFRGREIVAYDDIL